jgi:hypothetical protein
MIEGRKRTRIAITVINHLEKILAPRLAPKRVAEHEEGNM